MRRRSGAALLALLGLLASCRPARQERSGIDCTPRTLAACQGEKVPLQVIVRNRSAARIAAGDRFFISYHVRDLAGRMVRFDNRRFDLPAPVRPGGTARFEIPAYFSLEPGRYRLEWDLVREGDFWGRDKGWETGTVELDLRPLVAPEFRRAWLPTFWESGSAGIDREQYLLRQVFRNNEIRRGGTLFGFAAGSDYPQLWVRDFATMLPYARFFYPPAEMGAVVDRFLLAQTPAGEVQDWVDAIGRCDKNTVESDQESSLVLAAWQVALDDPAWLSGRLAGTTRLRRLDAALEWLWRERRDPERGLIWSGLTADWGDVERSYADQRAVKLSDRSRRTFSIYAQSLFIQAAQKLSRMAERLGDGLLAGKWRQRGGAVAAESRRQLYLADEGYFVVHRVANGEELFRQEKGILAVGGNAEAMRAGLMTRDEIARFLRVLEERRRELGLRTVSFTLLPPYPEGFFAHPLLRVPWSYQNGGEWDWIGGRLVSALYHHGFRREADGYLEEIVAKNLADMNVFEWSDRGGGGRGALFYAGAAGVIGEAILSGRLGLQEEFDRYLIAARGGETTLTVAKGGDRFTVTNAGRPAVDILSLSKKEICVASAAGEKTCIGKKGRSEITN